MAKKTAEEFAEALNNLADDLFSSEQGEQRDRWFNDHMKGAGYKPTLSWGDSDDDSDNDNVSNGYFGGQREKRTVGGNKSRKEKPKDWMYG